MSEQENRGNKRLEDFLNKKDASSMDDFEREAMEGFDLLNNQEEAMKLKNNLDKKIYGEVLAKSKKTPTRYWFAAAGLILAIGLSVVFVTNSNDQAQDLAVHQTKISPEEAILKSAAEKEEPGLSPPPAEQETPAFKAEEKQNTKDRQPEPSPSKSDFSAAKTSGVGEKMSMAERADDAEEISNEKPSAAPPQYPVHTEPSTINGNGAIETKEGNTDAKQDAAEYERIEKLSKQNKTTSKKKAELRPQPASQAPENMGSGGLTTVSSITVAGNENITYQGGNEALHQDIQDQLIKKNVEGAFDAKLTLNRNGVVESVTILTSIDLSKKEIKEILEILKSLSKFKVSNPSTLPDKIDYVIKYR